MNNKNRSELLKRWRKEGDLEALRELRAKDALRDNTRRTFGIEIECIIPINSINEIISYLASKNIKCTTEGYNHTTRNYWKITTDSSVRPNRGQAGIGREIVSPILQGEEGRRQVREVCNALKLVGAKVNKTCGFHVHFGAKDLSVEDCKNLFFLYAKHEDKIDSMVAPSRRGNVNAYCGTMTNQNYEQIRSASTIQDIANRIGTRYKKLNFYSYIRHQTIEIRHHQGTVEADKMLHWIDFGQALIRWAKYNSQNLSAEMYDGLEFTNEQIQWWNSRIEKLAV